MKQTKKLAAAVNASGTTLTEIFGVGPVIAAIVLGEAWDVSRFRDHDHFAAYNGTAASPRVDLGGGEGTGSLCPPQREALTDAGIDCP